MARSDRRRGDVEDIVEVGERARAHPAHENTRKKELMGAMMGARLREIAMCMRSVHNRILLSWAAPRDPSRRCTIYAGPRERRSRVGGDAIATCTRPLARADHPSQHHGVCLPTWRKLFRVRRDPF